MKTLVTGAGGYVGIPLCELLTQQGHKVVGLDRFYFGKYPKCEYYKNDIRNLGIFGNDIRESKIDCVIDLAGLSNDASCDIDIDLTLSINCEGGVNLARLAKAAGVKRYIYSSSCAVYGDGSGETNLTEQSPTNPLTQYAKCKKSVEDELLSLNGDGFEVIILRNSTIFGVAPRMRFDLAVNIMTARAWKEGVIYVMGGGEQWRPFVHVQDAVRAFCYFAELRSDINEVGGEIFNIGSSKNNIRIKDLANLVKKRLPRAEIHNIPDNSDQRSYNVSFEKYDKYTMNYCENSIEEGIDEIIEALNEGIINIDDPTCYTLQWYKSLLEWEKRIKELSINGKIL